MSKAPIHKGEDVPSPERTVESADRARNNFRAAEAALVEIAKLQVDGEHLKLATGDAKKDIREIRDRLIALEVNVSHLPSKGFIVAVVIAALTIIGGLLTIAPQLQRLAGTAQPSAPVSTRP